MEPNQRECSHAEPQSSPLWHEDSDAGLSAFQSPQPQSPQPQSPQPPQQSQQSGPADRDRVHAVALEWKRLHEMMDDHPDRELNLIKAYKVCGFDTRFHEIFNGLPNPANDSTAHFNFESHCPGAQVYVPSDKSDTVSHRSIQVLEKYFLVLRPHLEVACAAADEAHKELMKLITFDQRVLSADAAMSRESIVQTVSTVLIQMGTLHRHLHAIGNYRKMVTPVDPKW